MKCTIKLCDVENMDAEITLKMKVKDWRELRSQLSNNWPSWQFGVMINEMIAKAEQTIFNEKPTAGFE